MHKQKLGVSLHQQITKKENKVMKNNKFPIALNRKLSITEGQEITTDINLDGTTIGFKICQRDYPEGDLLEKTNGEVFLYITINNRDYCLEIPNDKNSWMFANEIPCKLVEVGCN